MALAGAEDVYANLFSEALSGFLEVPGDAAAEPKVGEWSTALVVEKRFCRHQNRQYTVQVAGNLLQGEPFGKLRRRGYGARVQKRLFALPAASAQYGFPSLELTSRSTCHDVARRRNLAPAVERFPALRSAGARPPLADLDEIDAADAAASWLSEKTNTKIREVREPGFRLDRPWLCGARRPRLLERQVGGLCEAADEEDERPSSSKTQVRRTPDAPRKTHAVVPEKSLKSKLKDALLKQMKNQRDVVQEVTSQAKDSRRRGDESYDYEEGEDNENGMKTGLWRLQHKETKRERLSRVTTCRRMKDQSEDVMNYRDRVNRSEVEVAQESFQRHFPSKTGNPWVPDQILEALSDFGIKAQSRTEKLALNVVLSEQETDEFGFNHFCSIIEEARCKLRAARAHTVFQAWKYADKEDVGALSTEAVLKLLEDLNLAFQKGTLERHYVEAMVQDCHTDPVTGLVGLPEVEFLVSAVREFMVQCQRRTERELQVQYELSDLIFHQFRSQLIRFHESFKELDDDDSGVLDPNEAMNLLSHFGCITSGMPLEKRQHAQELVQGYLADAADHTLPFHRFLCVVQDLRVLGMEEKAETVEALFNHYDRDHSGLLTIKDVCLLLMDLGIQPKSLAEQEAMAQLIEEADSDGKGELAVSQLLLLVQRILERMGELNRQELVRRAEGIGFTLRQAHSLWETFEALDASQDGLVPVHEVGQALQLMNWQLPTSKLQKHIDEQDADGNGQLDFLEFIHLMRRILDDVQNAGPKEKKEENREEEPEKENVKRSSIKDKNEKRRPRGAVVTGLQKKR